MIPFLKKKKSNQIKEYLSGVTADDLCDITDDKTVQVSNTFCKDERAPPPQYHLENNCGNVKERLTQYTLQNNLEDVN